MDDPRTDTDLERVELRPPAPLTRALLSDGYPRDEYPTVDSAQTAYQRAAEEIVAARRNGGMPADIFDSMLERIDETGITVCFAADDSLIIGSDRLRTDAVESITDDDGLRAMVFEDLDDDVLADLLIEHTTPDQRIEIAAEFLAASETPDTDTIRRFLDRVGVDPTDLADDGD